MRRITIKKDAAPEQAGSEATAPIVRTTIGIDRAELGADVTVIATVANEPPATPRMGAGTGTAFSDAANALTEFSRALQATQRLDLTDIRRNGPRLDLSVANPRLDSYDSALDGSRATMERNPRVQLLSLMLQEIMVDRDLRTMELLIAISLRVNNERMILEERVPYTRSSSLTGEGGNLGEMMSAMERHVCSSLYETIRARVWPTLATQIERELLAGMRR